MPKGLVKKPKETWDDPNRSAYCIYKFALPEFDAPSEVVFLQSIEKLDGIDAIYGLVERNCTTKKHFKVVCVPIKLEEKQQIRLPEGSFIFSIFFAPNGEQPPYPIQDGISIDPTIAPSTDVGSDADPTEKLYLLAVYSEAIADSDFTIYIHGTGAALYTPSVAHLGTIKFPNPKGGYFVHHVFLDLGNQVEPPNEERVDDNPIKIDP